MKTKKFFSKLKDYNNVLEQVLEKKYFSGNTKNLLLSMLYKIETAYDDYSKVKVNVKSKDEFLIDLIEIIKNYCDNIKTVEPFSENAKQLEKYNVKALTNEKERSILAYPTELSLLYAISDICPKYFYISKNFFLKEKFQTMLVEGLICNNTEILRNFNGWSWNDGQKDDVPVIYNLVYQNLLLLLKNEFIEEWEKNSSSKINYILLMKKNLEENYGRENMHEFYISLCRTLCSIASDSEKNKLEKYRIQTENDLRDLENKEEFLKKISKEKALLSSKIQKIDVILSNENLMVKEFKAKNSKLASDKKIVSLQKFANILNKEKNIYLEKIKVLNALMNPNKYLDRIIDLKEKKKILCGSYNTEEEITNLQIATLKCLLTKIEKVQEKQEIINIIYEIRYYKRLYLTESKRVIENKRINNLVDKANKIIITKACQVGIINIFCVDKMFNAEIINAALETNIIDLEDIRIEVNYNKEKIKLKILENEVLEKEIEIDMKVNTKDIKVRKKKSVKLLI